MPQNAPSIKILVCYHKPEHVFENEILTPIHLGRALTAKEDTDGTALADMLGDDGGDNISALNHKFCEMTALYWAWRNYAALGNPDYCGIMHYRRLLDFVGEHPSGVLHVGSPAEIRPESIAPNVIRGVVSRHDVCIKSPIKIKWLDPQGRPGFCNVLQQYLTVHGNRHLTDAFAAAVTRYPEYARDAQAYQSADKHYLCNIAVLRKDIFLDYARWMFDILFAVDKLIDYEDPEQDIRAGSYLSERLTGLYMTRLHRLGKFKIKHVPSINIDCY